MQNGLNREHLSERIKGLVELALACGKHFQSPQTKFVHYHYHSQEEEVHHTIPLLENFLFVLALFRSKTVEHATEAKELLERLLVFQSRGIEESEGHFPIYLHEYPICKERLLGIQLLAPLYWILKQFGHVLGSSLRQKLEKASLDLLNYCWIAHRQKSSPYALAVRLAAASQAFGNLLSHPLFTKQGEELLVSLHQASQENWCSTLAISDLLIAFQMLDLHAAKEGFWPSFWQFVEQTWHWHACAYVGPCIKEWQRKSEPEPTLYDLFLGCFSGRYAKRVSQLSLYHLQAALIQPYEEGLSQLLYPVSLNGQYRQAHWFLRHEKEWAYVALEKKETIQTPYDKLYTPFRFIWGREEMTHSLVCQGGYAESVMYQAHEESVAFVFTLPTSERDWEEKDKHREIQFFFDYQPDWKINVEGLSATTFQLGEEVQIVALPYAFGLKIELLEGQGNFLGHVMKGNRSSQLAAKGENRFHAYDWMIALRTVRRSGAVRLRVSFIKKSL